MKAFPFFLSALLVLAATPGIIGAPACLTPPTGLTGWWPGDGNANDIAGTNNGTLKGGATATAAGMVAQAFSFDGTNGYVSIPDSPVFHPTNLTVECWVRFTSLDSAVSGGAAQGEQFIVFKQNSQTWNFEGFDLSKIRVAGGDVFKFLVTSATAQTVELHASTLVTTGVWYHVAGLRGTNFAQIYVNGNLENQTNVSFPQDYGTLPLYFGTSGQAYWDCKLNGTLDEVSLYNRALSSSEVAAIYAAGAAGKCKMVSGLTITGQPQSQDVAVGSNAIFTVAASGAAPISYQWQLGAAAIPGATNTTLTLTNVQATNAGNYAVIVTNSAASVTSAVAVLTVLAPPAITSQPQSLTNAAGTAASFSATATGGAPLSYQWRLNGGNLANGGRINGATTNTLTISGVQASDAGSYALVVSNGVGIVTSAVAVLTVTGLPAILSQPVSQSVVAGTNVSFSVTASGTAPLTYQWRFNGANLSGATTNSLTLVGVQPANAGSYTVVVTNSAGSTTSAVAVLTVLPGAGTLIINGALTYQVIDGFGVNANSLSWTNNELQPVLDALIDQAGMTLFHAIVENSNWEATNDNANANVMNWTYYDTIYNAPDFQKLWGMMAYLNQRGITNGLIPKVGGPVALWMGGLSLTPGYENEYAETIASMLVYARNTQHLQFTEVRAVNEPDITYSGINLSGSAQYVTVMHDVGQQLDANGMSDVRFSGPDLAYTSTAWMTAMMGDPYLMSKVAHFGLHTYQGLSADATGISNFIKQSAYPNLHFWMTEFGVWCQSCQSGVSGNNTWAYARGTATYLLNLLAEGASAGLVFEAFDSQYYGYNPATGLSEPVSWSYWGLFAVTNINATPRTYTPRQGFYTLSQIARYVRPGAQRIDVSGSSTPLTLLAFYNTNNAQFTLTGANTNSSASSLSCALTSLPAIPSLNLYYTSSTTNLCFGGSVAVTNGAFALEVPADCVFTLTYTNTVVTTGAPPMILVAPASQTNQAGTTVVLSVEATGTAPLSYQWYRNVTNTLSDGSAVTGSASNILTLASVLGADGGAYTVVVSNVTGVVTSTPPAVLTVLDPVIAAQPVSRTNHTGSIAVFRVQANGTAPQYQWYKDGGPVNGGTQAALTLAGVTDGDAGGYSVVVSNAFGSVSSGTALLTVWDPPLITAGPVDATNLAGTTVVLSVEATGTAPLGYQWYQDETNALSDGSSVSGSASNILTLVSVLGAEGGAYTVVVSNVGGVVTSTPPAVLTVIDPVITAQPVSRTNLAGSTAVFSVQANGTAPQYQWYKDGGPVNGGTQAALTLAVVTDGDAGGYSVVVSNAYGSVSSGAAILTVWDPPLITAAPVDATNLAGTSVVLSVEATGTAPLGYQWYWDGTNALSDGSAVSGSASNLLTLVSVLGADGGAYTVVVSNVIGIVTSTPPAVLTVIDPVITAQPASRTNHAGGTAVFDVQAYGTAPQYQWYKDGGPVNGGTQAALTLAGVTERDAGGYSVVVSNAFGSATSGSADFTVVSPLTIEYITLGENGVVIGWNAVPGQNYLLEYTDSPDDTNWTDVPPVVNAIGPSLLVTNTPNNLSQGFYRVILAP